jgi:hypothetical protein
MSSIVPPDTASCSGRFNTIFQSQGHRKEWLEAPLQSSTQHLTGCTRIAPCWGHDHGAVDQFAGVFLVLAAA